jgi:N-acetylmuramoyl-L-alanine amidase
MPYFFYYLLKVTICSGFLFGYYHLFLRNKVYHAYNRFYLLAATLLSLVIPLLNFELIFNAEQSSSQSIRLLQVVNSGSEYLDEVFIYSNPQGISPNEWLYIGYALLSLFLLFSLIKVWMQIYRLLSTHKQQALNDVVFIPSREKGTPFSFFRYIFWNTDIDINSDTGRQIFAHELAHVREKHSLDKLYINCLLIVFWINPVFWLIKKELNLIHEFIADKKAIADNDAGALAAMIVKSAYPQHSFMLTSHFFYSPIKRRLKMLTKYKNSKAGYLYRILALPVVLSLVALLTIKAKSGISELVNPAEKITVMIDAGHGGQDGGAANAAGNIREKDLTLAFLKKIKELNNLENINLVFTRSTDIYQTPLEKVALAKEANADLCISIHIGSGPSAVGKRSGMEVYITQSNMVNMVSSGLVASAVIEQFKGNYALPVASNPVQRSGSIALLDKLNCPSIIIEAGYINNPGDLAYLQSEAAQTSFAKNLLSAIARYANQKDQLQMGLLEPSVQDTIPDLGEYEGKKIRNIRVRGKTKTVLVETIEGKQIVLTMEQAQKAGLLVPPPPPPPPSMVPPPPPPAAPPPPPPPPPASDLQEVIVKGFPTADGSQVPLFTDASQSIVNKPVTVTWATSDIFENSRGKGLTNTQPYQGGVQPVYIVEGKEVPSWQVQQIKPDHISSINITKGEEAKRKSSHVNAANGVVEIYLKGKTQLETDPAGALHVQADEITGAQKEGNRLYVGVTNVILFKNAPSDLVVNISNGSINKTNGQWIARVFKTGTTTVTLTTTSKKYLGTYNFESRLLEPGQAGTNTFISSIDIPDEQDLKVFTLVQKEAEFPGGAEAWKSYLRKNLDAKIPLKEGWPAGKHTVIVRFIVNRNGTVKEVVTENYKGTKTAQACIELITSTPSWIPAQQNGKTVASYKKQPVTFVIAEDVKRN